MDKIVNLKERISFKQLQQKITEEEGKKPMFFVNKRGSPGTLRDFTLPSSFRVAHWAWKISSEEEFIEEELASLCVEDKDGKCWMLTNLIDCLICITPGLNEGSPRHYQLRIPAYKQFNEGLLELHLDAISDSKEVMVTVEQPLFVNFDRHYLMGSDCPPTFELPG